MTSSLPLVSIMTPLFNEADHLPWAVSSVLAQTYSNWELVIVNDGSTDDSAKILAQIDDPRIKVITFPENRGRGVARQTILESIKGDYLCMLDADDWMYPRRIEEQVALLKANPEAALVSSGWAIVDGKGQIAGVRGVGNGEVTGPFYGLALPFPFPSSMINVSEIGDTQFDLRLRLAQDTDFIVRFLRGKLYIVTPNILYSYGEVESVTAAKASESMKFVRMHLRKHFINEPVSVIRQYILSLLKQAIYSGASFLKLDSQIINRRNRKPTSIEVIRHEEAIEVVANVVAKHFK